MTTTNSMKTQKRDLLDRMALEAIACSLGCLEDGTAATAHEQYATFAAIRDAAQKAMDRLARQNFPTVKED